MAAGSGLGESGMASDTVTALLHGESDAGAGSYNSFDRWSTSLRGGSAGSDGARLVTVHEALHVALNDTTAYGVLLAACSALARSNGGQYEAALLRLVGQCRGVHEAFATFQSLWLVVAGDASYLMGYPRYQRWYRDSSDLIPLPDHTRRKEMMLEAAARACMQAPVLDRIVSGATDFASWAPPASERPDERFALLHRVAGAGFWTRAWAACAATVSGTALWAALEASDHDVMVRPETYNDAFAEPLATCAHLLYGAVAGLLAEHGAVTLDYDEHRTRLAEIIGAVEVASPAARGLLLASNDNRSVQEESFEMWRRERLVLRDQPLPAVMRRFDKVVSDRRIPSLLSGKGEKMHVFAAARPADRLLEQFTIDQPGVAWLRGKGSDPVVTVRSTPNDSKVVELTVLDDPAQLTQLASALPHPLTAHVNISLACLGDLAWRGRWSRALRRARLTGLVDLSPMEQLNLWQRERQDFSYAQATIGDRHGEAAELMVWVVGDTNLPLLLVCTSVTCDVLQQYIERTYPTARWTSKVIQSRQTEIELVTSHLLLEEYFFDFAAYPNPTSSSEGTLP
jgi:hypothetical protein